MADIIDTRPYSLRNVVLDDGKEVPIPAYSNHDRDNGEWPLFTREQIPALLAATIPEHLQMVWIEEIDNFVVIMGHSNSLPVPFDLTPHMDAILKGEEVEDYQDGKGYNIQAAGKHQIEVDGQYLEVFDIDNVGYYFMRPIEPTSAPKP